MEALYHMPLSIWAVGALIKDDPLVPVHLLVWAVQTAVTTGTCVVEYMAWEGVEDGVVGGLHGLYGPYLGVGKLTGLFSTAIHANYVCSDCDRLGHVLEIEQDFGGAT
jgi:hypothetical protein